MTIITGTQVQVKHTQTTPWTETKTILEQTETWCTFYTVNEKNLNTQQPLPLHKGVPKFYIQIQNI